MKIINKICQISAIVFALASLVLFFTRFATIVSGGTELNIVGAQLGFGGKISVGDAEYNLAKSSDILFCFILTLFAAVTSGLSFKSRKLRYAAPAFGIVSAVYMLVISLSSPYAFVDKRPLPNITLLEYTPFVLITAIALFVFTAAAVAYLLIDDYLEVKASNGAKQTIAKRVVRFLRDYKSEIKKIVWPGWKEVVKNSVIVIIICALIGLLIWGIDFGFRYLFDTIFNVK